MTTVAVDVEDLQKIIEAATQIESLLSLLPDESSVRPLLKPMANTQLYGILTPGSIKSGQIHNRGLTVAQTGIFYR